MSFRVATPLSFQISRNMRDLRDRLSHVSSGRRVEKAADDAAGLGVATRLGTVAGSKRVAIRNIENGLDMLDTADGGMSEVADHLVRLRELAIQAASQTLSDEARAYVQDEYTGVLASINHAAGSTTWGSKPLLSFETVDVGLVVDVSGSMSGEIEETKNAINDFRQTFLDAGLNVGLGLAVMGLDSTDGVTREADIDSTEFVTELEELGAIVWQSMSPWSALLNASGAQDWAGEDDPDAFTWRPNPKRQVMILVTDTGLENPLTGYTQFQVATMLANQGIEVHTINPGWANGTFNTITSTTGGQTWDIGDASGSGIATALTSIAEDLSAELGIETTCQVQVSHGGGEEDRIDLELPLDATANGLGVSGTSVSTVENAREALDYIDTAISSLGESRAKVGAMSNRLLHALGAETAALEATEAAESRILDADMAAETAALAKAQILADVSISIYAQARQMERETIEAILEDVGAA